MGKRTTFLYLSEEDTIKAGVKDYKKCIDNAEEVFQLLSQGDYLMGGSNHNSHGMGLVFPKESPFPNMPLADRTEDLWQCPLILEEDLMSAGANGMGPTRQTKIRTCRDQC